MTSHEQHLTHEAARRKLRHQTTTREDLKVVISPRALELRWNRALIQNDPKTSTSLFLKKKSTALSSQKKWFMMLFCLSQEQFHSWNAIHVHQHLALTLCNEVQLGLGSMGYAMLRQARVARCFEPRHVEAMLKSKPANTKSQKMSRNCHCDGS